MMSAAEAAPGGTARTAESPLRLLRAALGDPRGLGLKVKRLGLTAVGWLEGDALAERLQQLVSLGLIDEAPTRLQVAVGSIDMLRFWISPAAADYYADKGINFAFHQVLRVLDDPAAMIDPVGFFVGRDAVIGHLLQVVHANPVYDVQLLSSYPDGLDALESQIEAMLAGTHPRQASIGAIVEEADYHGRLLAFVRDFRRDPATRAPVRENIARDPERFGALERTFGTLPAAMRYFCRMPSTTLAAARHLVTVQTFPEALAEPG